MSCVSCGLPVGESDRYCEACGATQPISDAAPSGEPTLDGDEVAGLVPPQPVPPQPVAAPPAPVDPLSVGPLTAAVPTGPPCAGCGAGSDQRDAEGYCLNCGMLVARPRDHQEYAPAATGSSEALSPLADVGAVSDRGIRHHRNEDAADLRVIVTPLPSIVAIVADGVSSSVDPDAASALAARVAGDEIATGLTALGGEPAPELVAALISGAVRKARSAVAGLAAPEARASGSPACTIVLAVVVAGEVHLSWLGDSRAYWVPIEGPAVALTADDSGAAEAIEAGIAPEVAYRMPQAHAITAWLGVDAPPIAPHLSRLPGQLLAAGGLLVVCSDGLWNYLTDDADFAERVRSRAAESLAAGDGSALDVARRLVDFAITAGGSDNITVAIVPAAAIGATVLERVTS